MSNEERPDSLADQAAAWVPPWQRPPAARPTSPPAEDSTPPAAEEPSPPPAESAAPTAAERPSPADEPTPSPAPVADLGHEGPPEGPITSTISGEAASASEGAASVSAEAGSASGGTASTVAEATSAEGGEAVAGVPLPEPEVGPVAGESGAAGVPERRGRRRAAPEPAPELDDAELRGALEAILLVVDEPVSELTLADVLEQPVERIGPMLDEIAAGYTAAGHGFELRRAAGGWRLYTRPEYAAYVERFVLDGQSVRLTQAALETLAVVAYKQPVTRSRISAIRGVNCDGVIRTLVSRGLVEECGTEPDSGAFLYRTTTMFLEKLGLNSLDDLPPLAPFLPDDVEELADATR
ncbi:segregation and condensation protein B [Micromonospora echinaurantiaca]|uniref:Segregation and condensation protein B n=1 Tax=Micromonospora echinaurantiaca TaxID=47857 RepID=A0A1C5IKG6_9ACTN|nr:SMC-Scp complex subunit ScpB [Micromonospora echinaurantiaca]SCG58613.1 segregation and condensation protein B [Micromonospora echinaurantiaca]